MNQINPDAVSAAAAILALLISIATAGWTILETRKSARRDNAMRMYEQWSSEAMSIHRTIALKNIRKHIKNSELKFMSELETNFPDIWEKSGSIKHFMSTLEALIRKKVVDHRLAAEIFSPALKDWFSVFLVELCWDDKDPGKSEFYTSIVNLKKMMKKK